jgi:hypothetical protein
MADDLIPKGQHDRSRINLNEDYEVRYWTNKLGVSKDDLRKALQTVGSSARAVEEFLQSKTTH